MHNFISSIDYIGILVQGGSLFYFLINAIFLFFILPQLQPKRNEATIAVHKSLGSLLLLYVINSALWIVPELLQPTCGYYQIAKDFPNYNTFMEYIDLAILPLSMVFGSTVLLGKLPKRWLTTSILIPYILYALNDIYSILPFKLYQFAYISTIIVTAIQLAWYGNFIKLFDKKLMENCSNIDRRSTKWVFWTLVPLFLLALLYIPLNMWCSDEWMVVYDFLTLLFLTGIVGCALSHKIDDMTVDLIKEQIEELKPEEDKKAEVEEEKQEEKQIEQTAASPIEMPEEQPEKAEAPIAEKQPEAKPTQSAKPVNETKFIGFDEVIKKLEADKFYLDTEVNIDWISSKIGTNRHYVSDYLNQVKHVTFYEYVNTLRLNHAEQLLKEGKEKVADIAFISGFNSDHTFRRLFKEKYGCTPLQYQKTA